MLETFQTVYLDNSVYTFTQITGPKSFALQRVFKSLRLKNVCQTETFFASNETGGIYEANSPFSSTIFRGKKSLFHVCARSAIAPKRKTKKVFWKTEMISGWPKKIAPPRTTTKCLVYFGRIGRLLQDRRNFLITLRTPDAMSAETFS